MDYALTDAFYLWLGLEFTYRVCLGTSTYICRLSPCIVFSVSLERTRPGQLAPGGQVQLQAGLQRDLNITIHVIGQATQGDSRESRVESWREARAPRRPRPRAKPLRYSNIRVLESTRVREIQEPFSALL